MQWYINFKATKTNYKTASALYPDHGLIKRDQKQINKRVPYNSSLNSTCLMDYNNVISIQNEVW